jgi:NmrA-like family
LRSSAVYISQLTYNLWQKSTLHFYCRSLRIVACRTHLYLFSYQSRQKLLLPTLRVAMPIRKVVVTNESTGQGKVMISCLSSIGSPKFKHCGLYPNPRYYPAAKLVYPDINRLPDGTNIPWKVFETLVNEIWSLLLVTLPGKDEEADAKQLIDAAVNNGVSQIVLLSTAHGNVAANGNVPYDDPGFQTKVNIEMFMKQQIAAQTAHPISWTILQPVAYYDLITPGRLGEAYSRSFQQLRYNVPLDLVAMEDVAKAAARVLGDPQLYNGKSIILAGDKLSFVEMNQIFREEVGRDIPLAPVSTPGSMPGSLSYVSPTLRRYFEWLEKGGFRIHPSLVRAAQPDMQSFRTWLRNSPQFKTGL